MKNETKKFSHLSKSERNEIAILLDKKHSLRNIAKALNRSVSAISDEIKLNNVRGKYDSKKAHHKAYIRRKYSKYQGMKINENKKLKKFMECLNFSTPYEVLEKHRKRKKRRGA